MTKLMRAVLFAVVVCVTMCMLGCARDTLLGFANAVLTNLGDNCLTKSYELTGYRTFGDDTYTGSYTASYKDATVHETLFGNTSFMRKEGQKVRLTGTLDDIKGSGALILKNGSEDPLTLVDESGIFDIELDILPGAQYIVFDGEKFTGNLQINIA